MPKTKELVADLRKRYSTSTAPNTTVISAILKEIAPPGKKREIKQAVIAELFPFSNSQGVKIADALTLYAEF